METKNNKLKRICFDFFNYYYYDLTNRGIKIVEEDKAWKHLKLESN